MSQNFPKRGEIWLVNFDPTIGSEIKKTRPAVILQNDIGNEFSSVTIVAAITSTMKAKRYVTSVLIKAPEGGLNNDSVILSGQIRTIDKVRLVKCLGILEAGTLKKVDHAIKLSLGLIDI